MTNVTGASAGAETTDVLLSCGLETVWGEPPATPLKDLRITGESLVGQKQRARFNEIQKKRQVSPSVTQQEAASGAINFNLSYGTFDDLFGAVLGNDWTTALAIDGAAADISTAATGNKLTSTTTGKFTSIVVGQFIRLYGFAANNGIYRVAAKTSAQDITLAGRVVTNETPIGTNAKIRGSMLRNGDQVQSVFIQKTIASEFFTYPGAVLTGMTLRGGVGQAFTGSFNGTAKEEDDPATDSSSGAHIPAPTGGFFDAVGSFGGVQLNDVAIDAVVQSVNLQLTREGAEMDYGMGSPSAQGARWGQLNPGGTIEMLFRNKAIWQLFKAETQRLISWTMRDPQGNAYAISLPAAVLMNGSPQAGGPNQTVRSTFTIEGAQDLASHCFQIDRFPAMP
nr:phage tail tube protein [uncultured Roseococcus sp.]